jgi:hypothetical protein
MDLLAEGVVTSFCLASSDRDFLPLATRLRRAGRTVSIIGRQLSERMRSAAHEFLDLSPPPFEGPFLRAFREAMGETGEVSLARVGTLLRTHEPELFIGLSKSRAARVALSRITELEVGGAAVNTVVRVRQVG